MRLNRNRNDDKGHTYEEDTRGYRVESRIAGTAQKAEKQVDDALSLFIHEKLASFSTFLGLLHGH